MGELLTVNRPRLVEISSLPTYCVENICKVEVHGHMLHIVLGEEQMWGRERVLMPLVKIIRPGDVDFVRQLEELLTIALRSGDPPPTLSQH